MERVALQTSKPILPISVKKSNISIIFFCIIAFNSCNQSMKNETIYIMYRGDNIYSYPDLVFTNSESSFVDSIMPIGKPDIYIIYNRNFHQLKSEISKSEKYNYNHRKYDTGILVIFYEDSVEVDSYLFSSFDEISSLKNHIGRAVQYDLTLKTNALDWINNVSYLYLKPNE